MYSQHLPGICIAQSPGQKWLITFWSSCLFHQWFSISRQNNIYNAIALMKLLDKAFIHMSTAVLYSCNPLILIEFIKWNNISINLEICNKKPKVKLVHFLFLLQGLDSLMPFIHFQIQLRPMRAYYVVSFCLLHLSLCNMKFNYFLHSKQLRAAFIFTSFFTEIMQTYWNFWLFINIAVVFIFACLHLCKCKYCDRKLWICWELQSFLLHLRKH